MTHLQEELFELQDTTYRDFHSSLMPGIDKSEFVERFPELSLFFKAFSLLNSEMICIFPYFCPCEIIVREIGEISFSHCLPPCREALLNHA